MKKSVCQKPWGRLTVYKIVENVPFRVDYGANPGGKALLVARRRDVSCAFATRPQSSRGSACVAVI